MYKKKNTRIDVLLFVLRGVSLSLLGILLLNPTITSTEIVNTKPILNILVDNSSSISKLSGSEELERVLNEINNNTSIGSKFDIEFYSFGNQLKLLVKAANSKLSTKQRRIRDLHCFLQTEIKL